MVRIPKETTFRDSAPSYSAKPVSDTLEALICEVMPHATYSPDLSPFDYLLYASVSHELAEQRLGSYEDVKKWFDNGSQQKGKIFTGVVLPERCEKCLTSDGAYLNKAFLSFFRI